MNDAAIHYLAGSMPSTAPRVAVAEERGAALDDRVCWSTVAGLSLIHVAGIVGVIWVIVNPVSRDARARGRDVHPVRPGDHGGIPPSVRPPHVSSIAARAVGHAGPRRGRLPELGAVVERRPPRPPRQHRSRRRPPRHHPRDLVRAHGLVVQPARRLGGRPPVDGPVGGAQHPLAAPVLRRPGHRDRPCRPDGDRRERGAIRGAACSLPDSCAPPSCCRRRSPSTRSPTSSEPGATTRGRRHATAPSRRSSPSVRAITTTTTASRSTTATGSAGGTTTPASGSSGRWPTCG